MRSKIILSMAVALATTASANASIATVNSPDGQLLVTVNSDAEGKLTYGVEYGGKLILEPSPSDW